MRSNATQQVLHLGLTLHATLLSRAFGLDVVVGFTMLLFVLIACGTAFTFSIAYGCYRLMGSADSTRNSLASCDRRFITECIHNSCCIGSGINWRGSSTIGRPTTTRLSFFGCRGFARDAVKARKSAAKLHWSRSRHGAKPISGKRVFPASNKNESNEDHCAHKTRQNFAHFKTRPRIKTARAAMRVPLLKALQVSSIRCIPL